MGFGTLARTGKLLSLVVDDVMVDNRAGFAGMLRFRETKTGQRERSHQSFAIENAVVRGAMQCLCRDLEPGKQLMQITDLKSPTGVGALRGFVATSGVQPAPKLHAKEVQRGSGQAPSRMTAWRSKPDVNMPPLRREIGISVGKSALV